MKDFGITWYEHLTIAPVADYVLVESVDENGTSSIRRVPIEKRAISIIIEQFPGHKFPGMLYTVLADFEVPLEEVMGFCLAELLESGSKVQDGHRTIIRMQQGQTIYYTLLMINKKLFGSKAFVLFGTPDLSIAAAIEAGLPRVRTGRPLGERDGT
jgi:hypothetical protein